MHKPYDILIFISVTDLNLEMRRLIKNIISQGGSVDDIFDEAIDDDEFCGSLLYNIDTIKKYAKDELYIGVIITYDDNHILVRCNIIQKYLGEYLLNRVPWGE